MFFFFFVRKAKTVSLSSKTGESMGLGLIVEGKIGIFFLLPPLFLRLIFDATTPNQQLG